MTSLFFFFYFVTFFSLKLDFSSRGNAQASVSTTIGESNDLLEEN